MIYEKDLDEAIAECQGDRNPNANTCIKLAAFITLKRELFGDGMRPMNDPPQSYSFAAEPAPDLVNYDGDTEFAQAVNGKKQADVWPVIDELMSTMQMMRPALYDKVMRRL